LETFHTGMAKSRKWDLHKSNDRVKSRWIQNRKR